MKKSIFTIAALLILAACNNKDKRAEEVQNARQSAIDSVSLANQQQRTLDSINAVSAASPEATVLDNDIKNSTIPVTPPPRKKENTPREVKPVEKQPTVNQPVTPGTSPTVQAQPQPVPAENTTVAAAEEKKKKGLNNAAKGAIIGLGTGAAAGAVIGKENRAKGAVIGGVIGAIGGAVGGAVIDKTKANKAKKEAAKKDSLKTEEEKK